MNLEYLTSFNSDLGQKLPVILQSETSECGDACLAMISAFFGCHISLLEFRERFGPASRGLSLLELISRASKIGLLGRGIRTEIEGLTDVKLPCILHWNLNHYVVLSKIQLDSSGFPKSFVIHDPSRGRLKLAPHELSNSFTGIVVELSPTINFTRKPKAKSIRLRDLLHSTFGLKAALTQIFFLATALELVSVLGPYFLQLVIDNALANQDLDLLWALVLGFGILTLMEVTLGVFRAWTILTINVSVNVQWLASLFGHLIRLPAHFFMRRNLSDVVSRFNSLRIIQKGISGDFVESIIDGILVASMIAMMFYYNIKLTVVTLCFSCAYIVLRIATFSSFRQAAEEYTRLQAQENSIFLESLRGIQAIKIHGHEAAQASRWITAFVASVNRSTKGQLLAIIFNWSFRFLSGVEYLLIIALGASSVMQGGLTVGMMLAFLAFRGTFSNRFHVLIDKIIDFRALSVHTERLADIALEQTENIAEHSKDMEGLQWDTISLELEDVWFRYSDHDPWILTGLDMKVEPGENLAIAGDSGAGKSTLLKIMLGLLQPSRGTVKINGVPVDKIGIATYRAMIGAVMQDDVLFSGSLRDNISFFDTLPDEEKILQACMGASVLGDIERMPMKFHTLIGDMGSSLSGGQYQRVLLARALYRNPKILLLDEATSHLDAEREVKVNEAVKRLEVTRITVAHREETLKSADRVLQLIAGKLEPRYKESHERQEYA